MSRFGAATHAPHAPAAHGETLGHLRLGAALGGLDASWMARAVCGDRRDDLFYPTGYLLAEEVAAAKALCLGCPVIAACRQYALDLPETEGIWGATTPAERRTLRRDQRQRRAAR